MVVTTRGTARVCVARGARGATYGNELGSNVIIGILALAGRASASLPLLVGCSEMWP